jgi:hypothetical protein
MIFFFSGYLSFSVHLYLFIRVQLDRHFLRKALRASKMAQQVKVLAWKPSELSVTPGFQ